MTLEGPCFFITSPTTKDLIRWFMAGWYIVFHLPSVCRQLLKGQLLSTYSRVKLSYFVYVLFLGMHLQVSSWSLIVWPWARDPRWINHWRWIVGSIHKHSLLLNTNKKRQIPYLVSLFFCGLSSVLLNFSSYLIILLYSNLFIELHIR